MNTKCNKDTILANIRRVAGQVHGVEKMVDEEREIKEILQQVTASSSALRSIAKQLLVDYSSGCFGSKGRLDKKDVEKLIEQIFKNM